MQKIALLFLCSFVFFGVQAQSILGAWESEDIAENGEKLKHIATFTEDYHVFTTYNAASGEFFQTKGGAWNLEGDILIEKLEFHTTNPDFVGTEESSKVLVTDSALVMLDKDLKFTRIDNGKPGDLQGAWLMSGRVVDGEAQVRDTSGPRKTMKILSGTRFQWIAYNTDTKQFMATGGGSYTTINGEYTENIEFFSRDNSRAGQSLKFNYSLRDGNWHHSGLSSKGDPIDEIWSLRE